MCISGVMAMVQHDNETNVTKVSIIGTNKCVIRLSSPNGVPIEECTFNGCLKYNELAPDDIIRSIEWKATIPDEHK